MDILVVTLWLLGIIISHLLLRRVVEIDNMNKQLIKEKKQPKMVEKEETEITDEDLKKELLEYVTTQDYQVPSVEFEMPRQMPVSLSNIGIPSPIDTTNVVQEFRDERDMNTGTFGDLEAYSGADGFAML